MTTEFTDLFPPAAPGTYFEIEEGEELENQSYEEFVDMGRRRPNIHGTGRLKMNQKRQEILVIHCGNNSSSSSIRSQQIKTLVEYLEKFMMMKVVYEEQIDAIDVNTSSFTLDSKVYDIEVSRKKRGKARLENRLEVFSLFDVLIHKNKSPFFSVIGLFDHILTEEGCEVMGRACGDRVACVSLQLCKPQLRTLLGTTCHELLHTIGIDHTSDHRCLMNAIASEEEWLFLCIENLRKLKLFHDEAGKRTRTIYSSIRDDGLKDEDAFIIAYHYNMLKMIQSNDYMKVSLKREAEWLEKVIKRFGGQMLPIASRDTEAF